jgi:hypothetical protein
MGHPFGFLRQGRRMRRRRIVTLGILAALAAMASGAAPAQAGLQQEYAIFSDCPVTVPNLKFCIVSNVTSGEFVMGSKTVPINKTVTLQGGLIGNGFEATLVPAADGNTLSKTPLQLPGGLVGLEVLPPLTEVTATAELAGTVNVSLENTAHGEGTAVSLPVKVKLDNPLLGNACYIGAESEPIKLQLTTGTTSPPATNKPISGNPGNILIQGGHGKILKVTNNSLVDNAFAAPGVNGCGGVLAPIVDPAVDLNAGLPAASGHNTAIMTGTVYVTQPRLVVAEAALPEFGRCKKAPGEKVGKVIVYHGGFNENGCIEENIVKGGPFEWSPGAGATKGLTFSSGTVTLEAANKSKLVCPHSAGSGEYTGVKSATVTITLTGCTHGASKESCQSAGAAAGEIVTGTLEGKLGFIQYEFKEATPFTSVGLDLTHQPSLFTAECGTAKTPLSVSGSVIGKLTPLDKTVPAFAVAFAQSAGKQEPEQFEGGPKSTLSEIFGSGSPEAAGLASKAKITNQEALAVKAEVE